MATISNTPRPGYAWDATDNCWYPIGTGPHTHADYITSSSAINPTIVDAKGDIIAASAADTPARLAVGNNGETLVADSSQTTGLRYNPSQAAGKNYAINGGFDIWQRGSSVGPISSVTQYTADRWYAYLGATPFTFSRQTSNLTGFQYALRMQRTAGNSGTNQSFFYQALETVNSIPLAGKTVTLSFYAKAGANFSPTSSALGVSLTSGTGTDQKHDSYTGSSTLINENVTLTTSFQRFSYSVAVGATATELAIGFGITPVGTAGADDFFEVTGVQLELGSVATTFTRTGGTIQGELAACQRYYYRQPAGVINQYFSTGGLIESSTSGWASISLPVTMRIAPTSVDYSGLTMQDSAGSSFNISAATIFTNGTGINTVRLTTTVSGATGGRWAFLRANTTNDYVGFSSEL